MREIPSVEDVRRDLEHAAMKKVAKGDEVGALRVKRMAKLNANAFHSLVLAFRQLQVGADEH